MRLFLALLYLLYLGIPLCAGFLLVLKLLPSARHAVSFKLALGFGLGLGLISYEMLFLGAWGLPFAGWVITLPISALLLGLLVWRRPQTSSSDLTRRAAEIRTLPQSGLFVLLFLYIAGTFGYIFWETFQMPVCAWDSVAHIVFRAKVFFYQNRFFPLDAFEHSAYPVHVSLILTWLMTNLGMWDDTLVKLVFPCTAIAYAVIHYHFLKYLTNRAWALLGVALVLSSNFFVTHAAIAYTDLFLLYYNCTGLFLMLLWQRTKENGFLILSALFAGLVTFTKLEGYGYLILYWILWGALLWRDRTLILKERCLRFLQFFFWSAAVFSIFVAYKITAGLPLLEKLDGSLTLPKIIILKNTLQTVSTNLFLSGNWNIVWFFLLLSLVNFRKIKTSLPLQFLTLALGLFSGYYLLLALFTINYQWIGGEFSSTTLSRLILHVFPLAPALIVLLNYPGTKKIIELYRAIASNSKINAKYGLPE